MPSGRQIFAFFCSPHDRRAQNSGCDALKPGDILVAPITDPSWTPLFLATAGVIVDVGAVMSHSVIVARDLGIPCAVSVTDATKIIPDGALVELDGDTGTVTILSLAPQTMAPAA